MYVYMLIYVVIHNLLTYMYICIYAYVYIYIYIYMNIHIYIHTRMCIQGSASDVAAAGFFMGASFAAVPCCRSCYVIVVYI